MVGTTWEIANGEGSDSLVMGGVVSVSDLLPLEDGSGELFALTGAAADCQEVPLGDGSPDVRDLEWDTWLRGIAEDTTQSGVLVVDAGGRPAAIDAECTFAGGSVGEVFLTDDGGYGSVSVAVEEDLLTGLDLPEVAAGMELTGISLDRDSEFLCVNTPLGEGKRNSRVRAYRVLADDLLSRGPFAVDTLSTGDPAVTG